jgi:hypothetical protein
LVKFAFKNIVFREVVEFDGHYILKFKASFDQTNYDLTKIYFSQTMNDKYEKKEKKDVVLNFSDYMVQEEYVCEECGKKIKVNKELIDQLEPYQGRDITKEEIINDKPEVLNFIDMQISDQTFGKKLCSECLKKYLKENNLI